MNASYQVSFFCLKILLVNFLEHCFANRVHVFFYKEMVTRSILNYETWQFLASATPIK